MLITVLLVFNPKPYRLFSRSIGTSKITILGYGLLTTDARHLLEALNKQRFGVVLVDESHYMKSRNAARSKILVPIIQNAKRAILLTGTPALGRPEEVRHPPNLFVIRFDLLSHLVICGVAFVGEKTGGDSVISGNISHATLIAHVTRDDVMNSEF